MIILILKPLTISFCVNLGKTIAQEKILPYLCRKLLKQTIMEKGKRICAVLKDIRQKIADANDIKYAPHECHHEGPCAGTCPACEAEVKYLESQLNTRRFLGKAVMLTGIAVGMTSVTACAQSKVPGNDGNDGDDIERLEGDVVAPEPDVRGKIPVPTDTICPIEPGVEPLAGIVPMRVPMYPGGSEEMDKFIKANMVYPKKALKKGIQGTVIVGANVQEDGTLTDLKVVKGVDSLLDKEALRIVKKMPKWEPAGVEKRSFVEYTEIPIVFEIKK